MKQLLRSAAEKTPTRRELVTVVSEGDSIDEDVEVLGSEPGVDNRTVVFLDVSALQLPD